MADIIKVCIDRKPPPKTFAERLALVNASKWQPGYAIRARFLDGEPALHERVKKFARIWTDFADLRLYFSDDPAADIRVSFKLQGSWSYIGTDCHNVSSADPTMNFGWLTPESPDDEISRVVLHEFGHALGCIHEHQNPAGNIQWNKPAVYAYFAGPPNSWSREEVDHNIFETYSKDVTSYSQLDAKSIMMYPIPKEFTTNGFEVGWNNALSESDKQFIKKMYP